MDKSILTALPDAAFVESYDPSVWLEFDWGGRSFQIFDECAFGNDIPDDSPARFHLTEYLIPREMVDDDEGTRDLGRFPTAEAALSALR